MSDGAASGKSPSTASRSQMLPSGRCGTRVLVSRERPSTGVPMRTVPRNIVVCCDGTDNEVATDSTNVLRLFRMLERDQRQVAYYDGGVGTLIDPAAISVVRKYLSRRLDAAIGLRVRENVIAAYRFLALNYQPGDQIYLFGFSRGAYTVRVVAGMIHFLGLLRPELEHLAPLAWTIYANEALVYPVSKRFAGGNRFNRSFGVTTKPPIHFVGAGTPSAPSAGSGTSEPCRTRPSTPRSPTSATRWPSTSAAPAFRQICTSLRRSNGRIASRSGSPAFTQTLAAATLKKRRRSRKCRSRGWSARRRLQVCWSTPTIASI